jgi:hypothetical protein
MRKLPLVSMPLLALALLCVALLTGCQVVPPSSSSSPSSPSSPDGAADETTTAEPTDPANKPVCSLASSAVVKSTLGLTVSEPSQSFDDTETLCTYTSTAGINPIVTFRTGQDAASFARARREAEATGDPTREVDGVGDEAYVTAEEFGNQVSNTLVVRRGAVILSVTAAVSVDAEKAFAAKVLSSIT